MKTKDYKRIAKRLAAEICGVLDEDAKYPQLKLADYTRKRLERAWDEYILAEFGP